MVEGTTPKQIEITFHASFSGGETRVMEYIAKLEQETKATSVHLLNHM